MRSGQRQRRRWLREIWISFPAWMYWGTALAFIQAAYVHLDPPEPGLAGVGFVPLGVFALFLWARARDRDFALPKARAAATGLLALVAIPALVVLTAQRSPLSRTALFRVYEVANLAMTPVLLLHARRAGRGTVLLFFGVGLLYGTVLENGGIYLGYFQEPSFVVYLPGCVAPLATMLGWVQVIYMTAFILRAWRRAGLDRALGRLPGLRSRPGRALAHGLIFACIGTGLDLLIDPVATHLGLWRWEGSLAGTFLGVPPLNFVAWMCALLPFGFMMSLLAEEGGSPETAAGAFPGWTRQALRRFLWLLPVTLFGASVLFFGAMTAVEGGFGGPTWRILGEAFERLAAIF